MNASRGQQHSTEQYQQRENLDSVRGASPLLSPAMPTLDASAAARGGAGERLAAQAFGDGRDLARLGLKVALEKQDEERALKATEILNNWQSGLNNWSAKYTQEKQGELATNAGAEFKAQAWQTGNQILEGIPDEKLRSLVMKGMAGKAMHFEETGLHYGNTQREAWKKSVLEGDQSQLLQTAGQNAYNHELIDSQLAAHIERYRQAHPGMDASAYEHDVKRKVLLEQFSAMAERKDWGGMEDLERRIGGDADSGQASGRLPLDQSNNPGNVKTTSGGYAAYETPADGLNAIAGRFLRYQESGKFGKAQTIRDALKIYAPVGDGKNNPDEYASFVKQETGLDPDQPMNFRSDPQALAKITRAVVMMENGKKATKNGDIYTQEQYAQGAADAIAGKTPVTGSGTPKGMAGGGQAASGALAGLLHPSERSHINSVIKSGKEQDLNEHVAVIGYSLARSYADNPQEGMRKIEELTQDPQQREKYAKAYLGQLHELDGMQTAQKRADQAKELTQAEAIVKQPGFSAERANILLSNASEEMKPKMQKVFNKALGIVSREINDPVAYEQARQNVLDGMPIEQVRALHYDRISDLKWEQLQTLANSKEEQRAAKADDEYFAYFWESSGIPEKYTGSDKHKADAFKARVKMEFGEFLRADNKPKSLEDREKWLYGKLAKRADDGMLWDTTYTPDVAREKVREGKQLYLEIPGEYLPTIKALLQHDGVADAPANREEYFRANRLALRGAQ